MSTVGLRHGISDRSDVHASVNVTALGAFGVLVVDAGASRLLVDPDGLRPAVVADSHVLLGVGSTEDGPSVRTAAEVELLSSWALGQGKHLVYAGLDAFLQPPVRGDATTAAPPSLLLGPLLGVRPVLGPRLTVPVQLTWFNPWSDTTALMLEYPAPGQRGALQLEVGVGVRLGEQR